MALIKKRKLTQNQTRQLKKNHDNLQDDGTLIDGIVVAHFGKQLDVQSTALPQLPQNNITLTIGEIWRCHARTNLPMLTTGDCVKFSLDPISKTGIIHSLMPRNSLITRPDRYHKIKPVAANVDSLVIVFAPLPKPATALIDRYLLIARLNKLRPLLILNKSDLLAKHPQSVDIFEEYHALADKFDFDILQTSSTTCHNINRLYELIDGKFSVFVGQSGVGKSSLINQLLPDANQSTNTISTNSQLGQHTTTTSRLLAYNRLDITKGGIIDTPGIREYGIWHLSADEILVGFDELYALKGQCQFRDCNHHQTAKGCALWQAVAKGDVLARRVISLTELIQEATSTH